MSGVETADLCFNAWRGKTQLWVGFDQLVNDVFIPSIKSLLVAIDFTRDIHVFQSDLDTVMRGLTYQLFLRTFSLGGWYFSFFKVNMVQRHCLHFKLQSAHLKYYYKTI